MIGSSMSEERWEDWGVPLETYLVVFNGGYFAAFLNKQTAVAYGVLTGEDFQIQKCLGKYKKGKRILVGANDKGAA